MFNMLCSWISRCLPLEWIDTVNELTTVGWTSHVTIKPLSNKSWIAESTKSECFMADKLFDKQTDGGTEQKGIL